MTEIDIKLVLRRAKDRSEQDGFAWYLDFTRRTRLNDGRARPLSEARRRLYLTKARAELSKEGDINA